MNQDSAVVLMKYGLFIDLRIDFVILSLKKRMGIISLNSKRPIPNGPFLRCLRRIEPFF